MFLGRWCLACNVNSRGRRDFYQKWHVFEDSGGNADVGGKVQLRVQDRGRNDVLETLQSVRLGGLRSISIHQITVWRVE